MKGSDVFFWGEKQQVSRNPLMSNTGWGGGARIQQTDTQTAETNTQIDPDSQ